jgi:hypothetical protein
MPPEDNFWRFDEGGLGVARLMSEQLMGLTPSDGWWVMALCAAGLIAQGVRRQRMVDGGVLLFPALIYLGLPMIMIPIYIAIDRTLFARYLIYGIPPLILLLALGLAHLPRRLPPRWVTGFQIAAVIVYGLMGLLPLWALYT